MKLGKHIFNLSFLLALFSCGGEKGTENSVDENCEFDQAAMLSNYANNGALVYIENALSEVNALQNTLTKGISSETGLTEARDVLFALQNNIQRVSSFAFSPETMFMDFIDRVNLFPIDTVTIKQNVEVSPHNYPTISNSVVGLTSLEFLLYGNAKSNAAIITLFQNENYAAYVKTLLSGLKSELEDFQTDWQNYASSFSTTLGSDASSSLSKLVNHFALDFEFVKNDKMKETAGRFDGVVKAHHTEGYYSGRTIEHLLNNFTFIENNFLGYNGVGLDDYLSCLTKNSASGNLSTKIQQQFAAIEKELTPLLNKRIEEVLISDKAQFEKAINAVQAMIPLVKLDMVSELNVQITYIDNDGD
jgi:uncharacterized iron-regulated protein